MSARPCVFVGRAGDAAELAVIVDLSSHSFATWLWLGATEAGEADTAMEFGRSWLADDDQLGGWRDAVIAEADDDIAGAAIGYALEEDILAVVPAQEALVPLVDLQKPLAGHWFIDSVGVYRRHRRKGVARRLVESEIGRAAGRPVSLAITESYNEAARSLYESLGFSGGGAARCGAAASGKRQTSMGFDDPQRG